MARRRRLMSASGAASFASVQSGSPFYNFTWEYLPQGQANFTSGPASDFDVSCTAKAAFLLPFCPGSEVACSTAASPSGQLGMRMHDHAALLLH